MKYILRISLVEDFYSDVCGCTIPEHLEGNIQGFDMRLGGNTRRDIINNAIEFLKGQGLTGTLSIK